MDRVYELTASPADKSKGTDGVVFRLMPDSQQVENALQVRC
jgi:hypothetical protein